MMWSFITPPGQNCLLHCDQFLSSVCLFLCVLTASDVHHGWIICYILNTCLASLQCASKCVPWKHLATKCFIALCTYFAFLCEFTHCWFSYNYFFLQRTVTRDSNENVNHAFAEETLWIWNTVMWKEDFTWRPSFSNCLKRQVNESLIINWRQAVVLLISKKWSGVVELGNGWTTGIKD